MEATGRRLTWSDLPPFIVEVIGDIVAGSVVRAVDQRGGFSPGLAARCTLADGRRVFVKAVSAAQNPDSPAFLRRETEVAALLPHHPAIPIVVGSGEADGWVVLALEDVEGTCPPLPWSDANLRTVFSTLASIRDAARGSIGDLPSIADDPIFTFWQQASAREVPIAGLDPRWRPRLDELTRLEARWSDAVQGEDLVHGDLRSDNVLIRPDGSFVVVDWPAASRGAPWIDALLLLPSVGLAGGPDPHDTASRLRPFADVEPGAVDTAVAALAGFFAVSGCQPPPPGLPTLRSFQLAQAEQCHRWLHQRLGWD